MANSRYIITLMLPDRIGILKDITTAVADAGGNIDAISQTVLADYFTVTLTASFANNQKRETLVKLISDPFSNDKASITIMPHESKGRHKENLHVERYIVTIIGKDSPGIIKAITTYFAEKSVNIEDWTIKYENGKVLHIGEVTIPSQLDLKQVQNEFAAALNQFELDGRIQKESIFRVTNEVGAVRELMK